MSDSKLLKPLPPSICHAVPPHPYACLRQVKVHPACSVDDCLACYQMDEAVRSAVYWYSPGKEGYENIWETGRNAGKKQVFDKLREFLEIDKKTDEAPNVGPVVVVGKTTYGTTS